MDLKGETLPLKKHHVIKGIVVFSLVFLIFGFTSPFTFAEGFQDLIGEISYRANFLYILLWPFVFLAGLFLDNSLVYGEAFGFDGLLWNLRNIVKNLSNFGLGFLLLRKIGENIRKGDAQSTFSISTLKGPLVAGVLIQISWFLMATLIDISTIATYGIGGLPLSLERTEVQISNNESSTSTNQEERRQRYTYGFHMDMNLNSTEDLYNLYLTTKKHYIAPCFEVGQFHLTGEGNFEITFLSGDNTTETGDLMEIKGITGAFLTFFYGAKEPSTNNIKEKILTGYCHIGNRVYDYKHIDPGDKNQSLKNYKDKFNQQHPDKNITPAALSTALQSGLTIQESTFFPRSCEDITKIGGSNYKCYSPFEFNQKLNQNDKEDGLFTLKDLNERYSSSLGPFQSFFYSLITNLDFQEVTNSSTSDFERFFKLSYNLLFIVLLAIPLATIGIIMAYRVFVLWMYIILLPFIILSNAFKKTWTDDYSLGGESKGIFSRQSILGTIFAPVIICFALSIAILFTSTMNEVFATNNYTIDFSNNFMNIDSWISLGKASGESVGHLVIAIAGLVLTWILLFTAIKATKLGAGIGGAIDKVATNFIKTVPIIPTSHGKLNLKSISTDTISNLGNQRINQDYGSYNSAVLDAWKQNLGIDTNGLNSTTEHFKKQRKKRDDTKKNTFLQGFSSQIGNYSGTKDISELYKNNFSISIDGLHGNITLDDIDITGLTTNKDNASVIGLRKLNEIITTLNSEKLESDKIAGKLEELINTASSGNENPLKEFFQTLSKDYTITIKDKDNKDHLFKRNFTQDKFEVTSAP